MLNKNFNVYQSFHSYKSLLKYPIFSKSIILQSNNLQKPYNDVTNKVSKIPSPSLSDFLVDKYNRMHNYLRISITDKCNLRCHVINFNLLC